MKTTLIFAASIAMFAAFAHFAAERGPGCHGEQPIGGLPGAAFTVCDGGRP